MLALPSPLRECWNGVLVGDKRDARDGEEAIDARGNRDVNSSSGVESVHRSDAPVCSKESPKRLR